MADSPRNLVYLKCTEPGCRSTKGSVETRADGDIVFRFRCPHGHSQVLSLRHTLTMALMREPVLLKTLVDNLPIPA